MSKRSVMVYCCLTLCAVGILSCSSSNSDQKTTHPEVHKNVSNLSLEDVQLSVGEPVVSERMAIYPVFSEIPLNEDPFITLGQALEAGTVDISEMGGGGGLAEVNQLLVMNNSGKPLYLMPGELLMGGQQDRCVAEETVLAASKQWQPIDVYCVEHGRWSMSDSVLTEGLANAVGLNRSAGPSTVGTLTHPALRRQSPSATQRQAQSNAQAQFVASPGLLNKDARLSVQDSRDQSVIWEEVAKTNALNMTETDSGTFTENYKNEQIAETLKRMRKTFEDPIATQENVVGVVVVVDGKPRMCDLYGSTPLFRKLWPKLLQSYALDVARAEDQSTETHTCSIDEVKKFLADTMDESDSAVADGGGGVKVNRSRRDDKYSFTSRHEDFGEAGFIHKASFE